MKKQTNKQLKSWVVFLAITTITFFVLFLGLLFSYDQCDCNYDNGWVTRTDFLVPNVLWLFPGLGIVIHGFGIVTITQTNYDYSRQDGKT